MFIKLNADDYMENGFTVDEAVILARRLSDAGIDGIEVSSGTLSSGEKLPAREKIDSLEKEGYNLDFALAVKKQVSCPVICVGGFRSFDIAQKAVVEGGMDFISLARPLIREPDLPEKWKTDKTYRARCISCNKCFISVSKGGIYCMAERKKSE